MMRAVVLLCFIALGFCLYAQPQIDFEETMFKSYISKFNKPYGSNEAEYALRFQNFKATLQRMKKVDKRAPFKIGLNKFSDMSREEFRRVMLPQRIPAQTLAESCLAQGVTATHIDVKDLPNSFDWRTKNVVTAVKDQGDCGSCWAFSTIANIESQWALKGNKLTQFSEQLLVDCSQGCSNEPPYGAVCNQGCNGGWQWNAYSDIIGWGGVETEDEYPYTATGGTCNLNKKLLEAKISNYTCLSNQNSSSGADEKLMASFMYTNGPLAIAIDAGYLQDYSSGVIDPWFGWECDGTQLDHALLLVGWGVEVSDIWGSTPYWIIKNSWGSDWGENGYFRIVRGSSACGVNNAVSTVVM